LLAAVTARGEVFLRCDPTVETVGNGAMVTVECTILSTETIEIRAVQVDLPCSLRPEPGTTGTAVKSAMFVDVNHQNPPFLFGPTGLGVVRQQDCRAGSVTPIAVFSDFLPANELRYLGTFAYDVQGVTGCGGQFNLEFEAYQTPPTISDQTRVVVPSGPRPGQTAIPFVPGGRPIRVANADGTACDDGRFCTAADSCQAGACQGRGTPCAGEACDEDLDECVPTACPGPGITKAVPATGTIDARAPYDLDDASLAARRGIGGPEEPILLSVGVAGATADCFPLCETAADEVLGPNDRNGVVEVPQGEYELTLLHPIAPGAVTTLSYGQQDFVSYVAHPGNANADDQANSDDVDSLIEYLDGAEPPFGMMSVDMDHSGAGNPADLIRIMDLFNGAELYDIWLDSDLPVAKTCP
jgi:hypothetical protein